MTRHLLALKDFSGDEISEMVDRAIRLKRRFKSGDAPELLKGKTLIMLFQKTSTRTRLSFEVGMTQLGGHAIFLSWQTTQFQMSDIRDEAGCLDRYGDIVMARLLANADLVKMSKAMTKPLINGLCEKYHPCQALADLQTMKEHLGDLKGRKVVYLGIGNNVSNSLTVGCTKFGAYFTLCVPEKHPPSVDDEIIAEARKTGLYDEEKDPERAVEGADILYTDTWVDMELFFDPKFEAEKKRRIERFMPYQLNKRLLDLNKKALVMHDLPAHRGYEIDDYAMGSDRSIIFDQAENRLHAQKAAMLWLMGIKV